MFGLALIWMTALTLVASSILWVLALIGVRLVRDARERVLAQERRTVTGALLGMLSSEASAAERLAPFLQRSQLMAEAIMELQGLIRGADQERVWAQLCAMGLPRILQQRLQRGTRDGRLVCLEALAALNNEEARAALWAATRQSDPQVRHLAFQALAAGDTPIPLELVLAETGRQRTRPSRLLTEVVRHAVTGDSARALAMLEDRNLAASDVALIIDSLGWTGDYSLIPVISAYAAHQEPDVRTAAIGSLGRLQHPMAEPALAAALNDPAWAVRAAAAEASGLANLGSLCEPLGQLLSDSEWWVRFRAGDALARLGSKGVTRLREIASTGDPLAQRAAELALAEHNL